MKRSIYLIITFAFFVIISNGCRKFLDEKPRGEIVPEKLSDFELLLNSEPLYKTYPSVLFYMTDNAYAGLSTTDNSSLAFAYYWNKDLDFGNQATPAAWGMLYNSLYTANIVALNALQATEATITKKQAVWAEALVYKADIYYNLLTVFAKAYNPATADKDWGVPLINSIDLSTKTLPVRSTVKTCFDSIVSYLTTAIPLLPKTNVNKARITKNAANAMLSRVYMYMGEYAKSMQYADSVIKTNPVLIDFNTLKEDGAGSYFYPVPKENTEILWQRESDLENFSSGPYFSAELYSLYAADDWRKVIYAEDPWNQGQYSFKILYMNFGIFASEVYFNKAEALARSGNTSLAMNTLNTVRKKRYKTATYEDATAATPAEALTKILEERRKDLPFMGIRWADMKRLNAKGEMPDVQRIGKDDGTVLATLKAGSVYTFEIPKRVQIFNPTMPKNF